MKKIMTFSLWLSLLSPIAALADNHEHKDKSSHCSCSKECKDQCKSSKSKNCQCDGKSCECKEGKSCKETSEESK